MIDSDGILDSSVLVDGHTAKQRYFHMQQAQTQQFFHSPSSGGKPGMHAQGITHFTSEKFPLLSAASSQRVLRELANTPSSDLLAATSAWTATKEHPEPSPKPVDS